MTIARAARPLPIFIHAHVNHLDVNNRRQDGAPTGDCRRPTAP